MANQTEKRCPICGETKVLDEFPRDRREKDGHFTYCKPCSAARSKAYRERNPEKARDARREFRKRHAPKIQAYQTDWRQQNPEKARAKAHIQNLVRAGKLKCPDSCENCGAICVVHGHHDDYSKPAKVRWLCPSCHNNHHAALRDKLLKGRSNG